MRVLPLVAATCLVPIALFARADEALMPDGSRVKGVLELDARGRLRLAVPGRPALSLDQVQQVRLTETELPAWRAATVHRIVLPSGQHLTAELIELNDKELHLRTAWAQRLSVPRSAVVAVVHPPGRVTLHDDDFEDGLKAWKLTGAPKLSDRQQTSGKQSLLLSNPGQAAEYILAEPVESGRIGINVHDPGEAAGARWLVEAEFARAAEAWTAGIVVVSSAAEYAVHVSDADGPARAVKRVQGWHRLTFRFSRDYLIVGIEDRLLWASEKEGPGGPLRKLRLSCLAQPGGGAVRGEVLFDDLSVVRYVDELPHRVEDAEQDEVWLLSGDQLFGRVVRADRRTIEMRVRSETHRLSWGQVRGLFPRREGVPPRASEGERVRVRLRSGAGGEGDELEGVVRELDVRRLVLRHAILGDVEIERGRLQRLRLP